MKLMGAELEDYHVFLVGYSAADPREIFKTAIAGGDWTAFPGDYVVVAEHGHEVHLVSSVLAAHPYYFHHDGARFTHGVNVFGIFSALGGEWVWCDRALRCLAMLGHTVGEDTLHAGIRRLPAATHLHWNGENLRSRARQAIGLECASASDAALEIAFEALVQSFLDLPRGNLVVSLSAGLDSRLLLALALRYRRPAKLVCMGSESSSDLRVARKLAKRAGLPLTQVTLDPEDYANVSTAASYVTGGSKTAINWHTAIYPKKAGLNASDVHAVGSNGEYARTFYLSQSNMSGWQLRTLCAMPGQMATVYWLARMTRRKRKISNAFSFMRDAGLGQVWADGSEAMRGIPKARTLGDQLDIFYALVRVRHFIGNGLALYGMHGRPCSPFLDRRWIDAVRALPRRQKIFDAFHRYAFSRLDSSFLDIPFNGKLYGPTGRPRSVEPVAGYTAFPRVISSESTKASLMNDNRLDIFVPQQQRAVMISTCHTEDMNLLLTLQAALTCIQRA